MKRRVLVKDKDVQKDRVRDEILNRVEQLIIQIKEEHNRKINKDYERRLAGTLVMSVFSLMKECPMKKKKFKIYKLSNRSFMWQIGGINDGI